MFIYQKTIYKISWWHDADDDADDDDDDAAAADDDDGGGDDDGDDDYDTLSGFWSGVKYGPIHHP